jgi:hypothetical protein
VTSKLQLHSGLVLVGSSSDITCCYWQVAVTFYIAISFSLWIAVTSELQLHSGLMLLASCC